MPGRDGALRLSTPCWAQAWGSLGHGLGQRTAGRRRALSTCIPCIPQCGWEGPPKWEGQEAHPRGAQAEWACPCLSHQLGLGRAGEGDESSCPGETMVPLPHSNGLGKRDTSWNSHTPSQPQETRGSVLQEEGRTAQKRVSRLVREIAEGKRVSAA